MKRFLMLLLCLALLSGCRADPQPPTDPMLTTDSGSDVQHTLLDQGAAYGETGNLLYIPNPYVESMACPEFRLYENSLLLYEYTFSGVLQLKRISLEDGSLLAEASVPATPAVTVQIGDGFIGLCDSGSGQVQILKDSLETEMTYNIPPEGENWCLNRAMDTLYLFFSEKGLQSRNLATGQTQWLLDNAAFVQSLGTDNDYVLFSYTDRADQKNYKRCLNLSTATLETLPIDGAVCSGVRSGEQWLLRQNMTPGAYVLVNEGKAVTFTRPDGMVKLLSGKQLLFADENYRELSVYDLDGKFLSQCTLPDTEYASVGADFVWSGYWQGYFFRDTFDNTAHLIFWDTDNAQEGEDLSVTLLEDARPPEPVMDASLYQKAEAISRRFGVDIRIAEQCSLDYTHYQAEALTDPYLVQRALNVLEMAFASYPEGFLRQLPCGDISHIRIELVANLQAQEDMDTHPVSVGGFTQEGDDHYLIVLDSISLGTKTVYHELSHVIDKRLEWDATLRPQALFSEEAWLALQPEGFRYAYSYVDMPDSVAAYENSGYFISSYSMTFPTEDRAMLMSHIISDKTILQENPGMAEKMRYYAACIRDCFDTEGWPETTLWE